MGHQDPSPAPPSELGPLLAALRRADIDFVVVGLTAARARGMDITGTGGDASVLEIAPDPSPANLDLLAAALSGWADPDQHAAKTPDMQPSSLDADAVHMPADLRWSTTLGKVNILLEPMGAPTTYRELLDNANTVDLDGVPVLAPTIEALAGGLAGSATSPGPTIHTNLARAGESATFLDVRATSSEPVMDRTGDLEQVILSTLRQADTPLSVRELLFVTMSWKKVRYKQVKAAAEALRTRGELLRDTHGAAHRYRVNPDTDDRLAHHILAMLADRPDPQAILDKVRSLLAAGNQG